jgi:CHAT domain-containing protein/Flp pilus assembly protein TadD
MLQFTVKPKKLRPFSYEILNGSLATQSGLLVVLVMAGITVPMMSATAATSSWLLGTGEHYSTIAQAATSTSESGVTITGHLDDNSPTLEGDGSRYNSHTFEGKAGEQIAILLSSQQFDAYLILSGVDGQQLAEDDDSSDGTNALVVVTLPINGTYTVFANSVGREARGEYQLQWRTATSADQALAQAGQLEQKVNQLYREGRYGEAIPPAEQALGLRRQILGENHPDVAANLNDLALLYRKQSRYDEAEPLYQQSLKILQTLLGENHPHVAQSLNNLAELYRNQGRYSEAEPLYQEALKIQKTVLDENHPDVADSLNNLAALYDDQGRYSEAEPLYQEALKIRQTVLGENHPDVADSLNNLAVLYYAQGRYSDAEPYFQQALKIRQTVLGENHPDVADSLNNLAALYDDQGRYSDAEFLYQEALKIRQTVLGENHPDFATDLNNLAALYHAQGRYSDAEPFFQQALKILQTVLGQNHPIVATSLNNLAALYNDQGRYSEAEPLYQQALKIRQTVLGENHPDVATSLNNLAALYDDQGRYSDAEFLYQEALKIRQTVLGENHPDFATDLNNLAALYYAQRRYSDAEPYFQQALKIRQTALGENHPDVAISLNNLAGLYYAQGAYSKAESYFQQALKIRQATLGENHPNVATSLNNLAGLYRVQGRYSEAEARYQKALKIRQMALGENHPDVAVSLIDLAGLSWVQGYLQPALTRLQQGLAIEELDLRLNLIGGSEANKRDYLATLDGSIDISLTLNLQYLPQDPAATQLALKTLLQRKGRLLDFFTNSQQILRDQLDPDSRALLDQLSQVRTQISNLSFNRPESLPQEQYQQQVKELNERHQQLEDQLSRRSATFRANNAPIDIPILQSLLPADGVLVEFSRYQVVDPKATGDKRFGESYYAAYLLQSDGKITGIDLGAASTIDPLIAAYSAAVRNPRVSVEQVKEAARALDAVLMAPIRSHLGSQKHLLISPDGPLNLIPFEALVDQNSRYLVESFNLTYLTSGRDLLRLQAQSQAQQPPLLLSDPIFNQPGQTVSQAPGNTRSIDLSQHSFPPLPETKTEVEAIARLLSSSQIHKQSQATEAVIKQADRPQILHIATHGFFEPSDDSQPPSFDNPLLRSGLVLAGFRVGQSSGEDGILTALEVSSLNLLGTQMVVLSACDTGQGDLSAGEGVYGLRRALVLAGSESQVISLWQVLDAPTKNLMVSYYEQLLQGKGRSEALREVQLTMLKDEQTAHPYYWAPFIQSGDWSPMSFSRTP